MAFERVTRRPAYLQVAEQIRAGILAGDLVPGAPLPTERELSVEFGVGRTTVREALRTLQAQGFLRSEGSAPHRTVVGRTANVVEQAFEVLVSDEQVTAVDMVDLRSCIETGAIQRGVLGASPRWVDVAGALERMQRLAGAEDLQDPSTIEDLYCAYRDFHLALVAASGSPMMTMTMRALQHALEGVVKRGLYEQLSGPGQREDLDHLVREHVELLDALRGADAVRAQDLVRRHDYDFFFRVYYGESAMPDAASGSTLRREAP